MKEKYIRIAVMTLVPSAVFGGIIYALASQELLLVACIFAGVVIAIPTGMLYYRRVEKSDNGEE